MAHQLFPRGSCLWAWAVLTIGGVAVAQTAEAPAPPGRLVDLGGYKLHLNCFGKGRPTVVLDAGMGDSSAVWALVQPELSRTTRACTYDRAGTAWSDLGPVPRTMKQEVAELRELLRRANESGPFILVGHSYAGLLARLYATTFPTEVAGIVLVDSTHESTTLSLMGPGENQPRLVRMREQSKGRPVPPVQTMTSSPPKMASAEEMRQMESFLTELRKAGKLGPPFDRLPAEAQKAEFWARTHPKFSSQAENYWPEELQAMFEERNRNPRTLGDLTLVVLAAGRLEGMPADLQKEKEEQKQDLARLSSNSRFIRDPGSGHHIHIENPALVLQAVRNVIEAVRTGRPLAAGE